MSSGERGGEVPHPLSSVASVSSPSVCL